MNYFRQLELAADPDQLAIEELINPKINELNYFDWIANKRSNGKKKFNRIDKRQRRFSIKKKRLGINQ
jgi:hypothetical protein